MGTGSKVLTDLVESLEEPAVAVELRLKINQNHEDLQGGYACCFTSLEALIPCVKQKYFLLFLFLVHASYDCIVSFSC